MSNTLLCRNKGKQLETQLLKIVLNNVVQRGSGPDKEQQGCQSVSEKIANLMRCLIWGRVDRFQNRFFDQHFLFRFLKLIYRTSTSILKSF